jgi:hypothetical protein
VRPAGYHRQPLGRRPSAGDPTAFAILLDERADPASTAEQSPQGGRQHDAEARFAVLDQGDVHRELAGAVDELLGAVQRVGEPEASVEVGYATPRVGLLGHHRNVRGERRQPGEDS